VVAPRPVCWQARAMQPMPAPRLHSETAVPNHQSLGCSRLRSYYGCGALMVPSCAPSCASMPPRAEPL